MATLFHSCFNLRDLLSLIRWPYFTKPPPPPPLASVHGPWNDISTDLAHLIAKKSGHSYRRSLAAVRKFWASMKQDHLSDVEERLPWFVLPHDPRSQWLRCLNLSQGTVESLRLPALLRDGEFMGSTNGWLVFFKIEDNVKEALLFLFNPISRQLLKLPPLPKTSCYHHWLSEEGSLYDYINSVIVSSNLIKESTVIAATFCNGLELAMCKPGDDQWTIFTGSLDLEEYESAMERFLETQDDDSTVFYIDILFHDDTLLVLVDLRTHGADRSSHPRNNRVYFLESLKLVFINSYIDQGGDSGSESCSECLIISNEISGRYVGYLNLTISVHGELLLIVRWAVCSHEDDQSLFETTKKVDIFKLDINGDKEISRLEDIGDQVIFVSRIESRAMDSTSLTGIQGNCIYFAGNSSFEAIEEGNVSFVRRETGVYNLRDGRVVRSFSSEIRSYSFQSDWFLPIY